MPHILKLLSCKRGGGVARYTTGPKQASNIHSLTAKHKSTFVQLCATGYPWPDRTFRSFSASKPADWQILRCLETAIYGFWGAEIVKCSVGSNPKKVFHQHRPPSSDVSCLVCLSGLELKKQSLQRAVLKMISQCHQIWVWLIRFLGPIPAVQCWSWNIDKISARCQSF